MVTFAPSCTKFKRWWCTGCDWMDLFDAISMAGSMIKVHKMVLHLGGSICDCHLYVYIENELIMQMSVWIKMVKFCKLDYAMVGEVIHFIGLEYSVIVQVRAYQSFVSKRPILVDTQIDRSVWGSVPIRATVTNQCSVHGVPKISTRENMQIFKNG
jgi:hypothetical protein